MWIELNFVLLNGMHILPFCWLAVCDHYNYCLIVKKLRFLTMKYDSQIILEENV